MLNDLRFHHQKCTSLTVSSFQVMKQIVSWQEHQQYYNTFLALTTEPSLTSMYMNLYEFFVIQGQISLSKKQK